MWSGITLTLLTSLLASKAVFAIPPPKADLTPEEQPPPAQATPAPEVQTGIQTQHLTAIPTGTAMPAPASTDTTRQIHPWGRPDVCLTVQGGELIEGAEVGIEYCSQAQDNLRTWQAWEINRVSEGPVKIGSGNNTLCLSGGSVRDDATRPRLAKCDETKAAVGKGLVFAPKQYQLEVQPTDDKTKTLCLDVRHDSPKYKGKNWSSLKDVQLWSCSEDKPDTNQAWMVIDEGGSYSGQARPDDFKEDEDVKSGDDKDGKDGKDDEDK